MTESILAWMKQHESRHIGNQTVKRSSINSHYLDPLSVSSNEPKNPQKTMDGFLAKPTSDLFDQDFSKADFALITAEWKAKFNEEIKA